jgi:mxaC protein
LSIIFAQPWLLLLSVLALIPLLRTGQTPLSYSSAALIPEDPLSTAFDWLLRLTAAASIVCLAIALAGPYTREQWIEKVGTGAHIVLLLDRSSSMNDNFSGRHLGGGVYESKSAVARNLLERFVNRRENDLFAMIAFSASPIYVLPLTQDHEAVLAAIRSAGGRGHGLTNIAPGLAMALDQFSGQPVTGSRIILLVSDGAARIDEETRDRLKQGFQDNQVTLYWIYLRNPTSARLSERPRNPGESTTPEYFLHEYFSTLGVPYRAYEADNPNALKHAIADVERLENRPLRYLEKLPRKDLSGYCYVAALLGISLLALATAAEVREWT